MRQMKKIMPIYSGDVSGVPSALYELGGMVVMHDASGCNSTYNTHDELRWYDQDSLIYISGMTELDAVMGNDKRLIEDISDAALDLKPKFIALSGTPIPFLNGMDFNAVCKIIEKKTNIPTFFVQTNGMHTYVKGAGEAFAQIAEIFVNSSAQDLSQSNVKNNLNSNDVKKEIYYVNVLGVTPLDFALSGFEKSVRELLNESGFEMISCWSMGSTMEEIKNSAKADVNLVVSATGLKAAKVMERKFKIPYVVGTPIGNFAHKIIDDMKKAIVTGTSMISYSDRKQIRDSDVIIAGESVMSESLAAAIEQKYGVFPKVLCTVETQDGLLLTNDKFTNEEEEFEEETKNSRIIIADPLLKFNCPEKSKFYELPHVACSGRMYARNMPDLTKILK